MSSNLELIKKVDTVPYPHEKEYDSFTSSIYKLYSHNGSFQIGYITKDIAHKLLESSNFEEIKGRNQEIKLNSNLDTIEERELILKKLGDSWKSLKNLNIFKDLESAWRNEEYIIYDESGNHYFKLERSMCPYLGVVMYGVHINGYVLDSNNNFKIWTPRRAINKPTFPGMLDNTVAGGLGYPYGPFETCIKECYEEAGLSEVYIRKNLKSVGLISYLYNDENSGYSTIQPECEYVYDLNMSDGTIPKPVDGESEDFQLMDIEEIKQNLKNNKFKDNCAAILIDFMIRHAIINPENEPDFIEINSRLHRFLPIPFKKN